MKQFFKDLLTSNSGISSKAFFLVSTTLAGCLILLAVAFVLIFEVIKNGTIRTDLGGLAAFIGAVAGLFATAGATKAFGERNENHSGLPADKKEDGNEK
jgi:hypothetical protein